MTTLLLLTSPYILVIALHSNIFILFPTNNSVGNTRLFWNQLLFSFENKHLSAFLSRGLALSLLTVFKLFFKSASGPNFPCACSWSTKNGAFKSYTKNMELQTATIAPMVQHIFPVNPDVLRCSHSLIQLSRCLSISMMLLLWFPTSVSCEGLNQATDLTSNELRANLQDKV